MVTLYVRESDSGPLHTRAELLPRPGIPGQQRIRQGVPAHKGRFRQPGPPAVAFKGEGGPSEGGGRAPQAAHRVQGGPRGEIKELKKLVNWRGDEAEFETVGADIIGQSPDNWQRLMIVNKGSSSGVKKYMAVVTDEGLVGRVISVGSRSSVVQLITDSRSGVGVTRPAVQGDRHSRGAERRGHQVRPHERGRGHPKVGDIVETSGLGGTVPAGRRRSGR